MLGKTFRGGTTLGLHLDSNASGVSLQLCIHFTQLSSTDKCTVMHGPQCPDLNTQLQAVPIGQALRGGVLFTTFYHHS